MKINLHIDQIVIDGPSLTRREREHLARALEQELVPPAAPALAPASAARQLGAPGRARTPTARPHWEPGLPMMCWPHCPLAPSPEAARPS